MCFIGAAVLQQVTVIVFQVSVGGRRSEAGGGLTKGKSMPSLRLVDV